MSTVVFASVAGIIVLFAAALLIIESRRNHRKNIEKIEQEIIRKFKDKKITVLLYTRDGRQHDVESILIGVMIKLGLQVPTLDRPKREAIRAEGIKALSEYELCLLVIYHHAFNAFTGHSYTVDTRLINNKGMYIASGTATTGSYKEVPWEILKILAESNSVN